MEIVVRWTIGPVSCVGIEILEESVSRFSKIYPEFTRIICFNNLKYNKIKYFEKFATLHEQKEKTVPCKLSSPNNNLEEATGCGWKLAPPRLKIDGLELFIDNDIIIRKRIPQIDDWIKNKNFGLITEGLNRKRMYGVFDSFISPEIHANAGLFGLPPHFDFEKEIKEYSHYLDSPLGGYNEQGLTVATIVNMKNYIMVPLTELNIIEDHVKFPEIMPSGLHFVGANRKEYHRGWKEYKKRNFIFL